METARYGSYEDGLTEVAEVACTLARTCASTYRVVPLDVNQPTYMRGPGCGHRRVRPRVGDGRTGGSARHGPHRAAAAQRTRPRPERRACRSRPAGSPSASARAPTSSAGRGAIPTPACGARRRPADRNGHGRGGVYHTSAQRVRRRWRGSTPTAPPTCQTATSDMGPGTYTSMTQVAADALGLPMRPGPVRARRQPLSRRRRRTTARRTMASVGSGGRHGREHAARQVHSHRRRRPRLAAERGRGPRT